MFEYQTLFRTVTDKFISVCMTICDYCISLYTGSVQFIFKFHGNLKLYWFTWKLHGIIIILNTSSSFGNFILCHLAIVASELAKDKQC